MHHHGFPIESLVSRLPVVTGFALCEAVNLRLGHHSGLDHVTRARARAGNRTRAELTRRYRLV